MTQGLGSFVEGLQGGMAARSKRDLSTQYERILADQADVADRDFQNVMDTERDMWAGEHGGSTEGYVAPERTKIQDPALIRLGKFLGGKIKGAFGSGQAQQDASFVSPEIAPSSPVAQRAAGGFQQGGGGFQQGMGIPQQGPMQQPYRDGGLVRGYADGGPVEESEEMKRQRALGRKTTASLNRVPETAGGGGIEIARDIGRGVGTAFDDTARVWGAADEAMGERRQGISDAKGAAETGDAVREWLWEGTKGTLASGAALAKDVIVDNPVTQGVLGFLGVDGGESEGIPTPQTPTTPSTEDPAASAAVTNAIDPPDNTDSDMAETAMSEGEVAALENPDFTKMAAEGTRPEDLPTMSTQEWADYRSHLFQLEIGRGRSAKEAMQSVEYATVEVQMRGFQRGAQQAAAFLIGGQNEEAALALTNAYQYFPNGSGVRFGSVTDPKTGLPVIMAMGINEETGEPSGAPMIMTADKLSTLVAQMKDPKAFSAWTKDGHQLQIDVAKMQDQQERTDIYGYNADTARMNARTSQAGASGGGLSASELRQRESVYRDSISGDLDLVLDQPEHARSLARAMSKLESMYPGIAQNAVIDEVYRAYDLDKENMSGIEALINPQAQQTGIPEG